MKTISTVAVLLLVGCSQPAVHTGTDLTSTPATRSATNKAPEKLNLAEARTTVAKPPPEGDWHSMFNGTNLADWKETAFAGRGEVAVDDGLIVLRTGDPFTGINWTNAFPSNHYEITLEAMRLTGSDFFCGLTVPEGTNFCSLIVGGWGGSLLGISSLDGMDASENETTRFLNFEQKKWYRLRFRVTPQRLQVWLDEKRIVDQDIRDKRISVRPGDIEMSIPIGISSWQTTAALRDIRWRTIEGPDRTRPSQQD